MDNGVMKMRPVEGGLEIKPGQTVKLDPGGYHVMLMGLKQQLKEGEHFKATLEFAKAGKVDVDFTIEGMGAMSIGGTHPMPGRHADEDEADRVTRRRRSLPADRLRQPGGNAGEGEHQHQRDDLHGHERHDAAIDVAVCVTSGGATPRRKNSDQPNGGVRNEVCRFTQIIVASQTRSVLALMKIGRNSGTAM